MSVSSATAMSATSAANPRDIEFYNNITDYLSSCSTDKHKYEVVQKEIKTYLDGTNAVSVSTERFHSSDILKKVDTEAIAHRLEQTKITEGCIYKEPLEQKVGKQKSETEVGVYHGDLLNGKPSGFGVMKYKTDDSFYAGDWKNGKRDGQGFIFSNERFYLGEWLCDKRHGLGVYSCYEGKTYDGQWKANHYHIYSFIDGIEWKHDWHVCTTIGNGDLTYSESLTGIGTLRTNRECKVPV